MTVTIKHRITGETLWEVEGADLTGAYLTGATIGQHVTGSWIGQVRRSDGYEFLGLKTKAGALLIRAGCRTLTLPEYEAHIVAEYEGTPKAAETRRILKFLREGMEQ